MAQVLDAIFENGVFRPLGRPELAEGQRVSLIIEPAAPLSPDEMLELAGKVYEGLSEDEVRDLERIALDRRDFFGQGRS
jgi:predicted DNA-binding antitoxin AbrB/MazE fold protein